MKRFREELEEQLQREDEKWRRDRAADDALFERLIVREVERNARKSANGDDQMRRDVSALSPIEYANHRAWADYLTNGLKSNQLTMTDVLDILRTGDEPV